MAAAVETLPKATYNVSLGYLRAFVTLLVLAHHSVLSYTSFAPPPPNSLIPQPRWWQAFPVVDAHRWPGFDLLVGFNDLYFMSLMFFLSGLFVASSLRRKGAGAFLRDRALRLGIPFVVAAAILAPLAYWPAYRMTGSSAGFWNQWFALGNWPAGPVWFIWLLLAFDVVAAALFVILPRWPEAVGRILPSRRPLAFFGVLAALSAAAYIPMAVNFHPLSWTAFGPFTFQTSRLLHYALYFLIAVAVGACGIDRGILAPGGKLARRWPLWGIAALLAFVLNAAFTLGAISGGKAAGQFALGLTGTFVLCCAASSFACLALFLRFARTRGPIWDSLTRNAYGMYLVHYVFANWTTYTLLPANFPGVLKGAIAFAATLLLSWAATAALRRIPAIARIL